MRTDLRHFPEKERLFMQRSLSLFTQNFIFVVYATGPRVVLFPAAGHQHPGADVASRTLMVLYMILCCTVRAMKFAQIAKKKHLNYLPTRPP